MEPLVRVEHHDEVALIVLERPARANAYDTALLAALRDALEAARDARVLVIGGAGRHFCAGADLDEMRGRSLIDALHLESARLFDRLAAWPSPTIAAIQGAALGGGLELALACDLRVAADDAELGLPETALGIIPAAGGTLRLPRVVGMARAKELIFTGRRISAQAALTIGLVNEVVPRAALIETALALGREIAAHDPLAIQLAKAALQSGSERYPAIAQALLYHRKAVNGHA